jgi:hypothetical protein
MRKLATVAFLEMLLSLTLAAQSPKPSSAPVKAAPPSNAKQRSSPGFLDRVLTFLGISDSPGTLKGPGDEVRSGELWVVDLASQTTRAVTQGGRYRSPIFAAANNEILALSGQDLLQVSARSGEMNKLFSIADISKLVGFSGSDPDTVLILQSGSVGQHAQVALLSIRTGRVTTLPYDPASSADLQMVENLEGWTRTYGDKQVFVRRQTKQALSGTVEWSDVFIQSSGAAPRDVSLCNGTNCGQPSMSADGRSLVFVKSPPD